MTDKTITPTHLRQNIYQYIKATNNGETFKIEGKDKNTTAILTSANNYKHLKDMEITLQTTPQDLLYQKLHMLDEIENNETFYNIAESIIMNSWRQNMAPNQDPLWPITTELIACLSCYVLRAEQKALNQTNLKKLAEKSFHELVQVTKKQKFKNDNEKAKYQQVIEKCITHLNAFATSETTQKTCMQIYRLTL